MTVTPCWRERSESRRMISSPVCMSRLAVGSSARMMAGSLAIARALANDPAIILADEPTANLDMHTGEEIIRLLSDLSRQQGVTVITATHDHKMLAASNRIVWIEGGKV